MALSLELGLPLLIDDQKGRKVAEKLGLKYIGTLGLLKIAKKKEIISTVKPLIDSFISSGYYLDKNLVEKFLKDLGEI